ncbi:MAG: hypothetical protein CSB15_01410 [Clostridiales bacterium]|nr:MAG: hypothetical protein CSB15_01410 [Clostridiales bacterium]
MEKKFKIIKLAYRIFLLAFALSLAMSFLSQTIMDGSTLIFKLIILLLIILLGILFDMIGVAVAVCNPAPFHSMASKKNPIAKIAIKLIKKASLVATFSNDVIGDIAGIISGAAVASIVYKIMNFKLPFSFTVISMILSGLVAGLTVGGKAIGKEFAINNSKVIIYNVAKVIYYTKYFFTLKWIRKLK